MNSPFEFSDLQKRLEEKGLTAVEGLAEIVAGEVFDWTEESLAIHPNMLVKGIGLPAVAILKPLAMGAIDKLDGKEG